MAGKIRIGNENGIACNGSKIYIGDEQSIARKVKKIYIGDENNKARLAYGSFVLPNLRANISKPAGTLTVTMTPSGTDEMGNVITTSKDIYRTEEGHAIYFRTLSTMIEVSQTQIQTLIENGYTSVKGYVEMSWFQFGFGLWSVSVNGDSEEGDTRYNGSISAHSSSYNLSEIRSFRLECWASGGYGEDEGYLLLNNGFYINNIITFS